MFTNVLDPVGVEITGVSLRAADETLATTMRQLLADHGVAILRETDVHDDESFTAFLRQFGELVFTVGETPVAEHPNLNVVSNVGRTTPPRSVFHVDTSYISRPPAYTALRAVTIPAQGGETLFTNQYRAYQTLPADVRELLKERSVRHVVTGVDPGGQQDREAWHPIFRPHPLTQRIALYLSTPQRCVAISGLDEDEGRELIEYLYAHSTRPDNTLRHAWSPGDLVMWDNGCVLHRADHSGVVGDRVLHRGMVADYHSASIPA